MELPIRTSARLAEIVKDAELPPISDTAAKLVAALSDENVDIALVRDLIAQDPVLSASLLRWANSPIYGAARSVRSLEAAIQILGLAKVCARAVGALVSNALAPQISVERPLFWASCMRSADWAGWLAPMAKVDPNEAWLSAMMVRLGELILSTLDPASLAMVELNAPKVPERWQREREKFGFDEGDVMAEVTRSWFFPDAMVAALHKTAQPMIYMEFSPLSAVLHLAMLLADHDPVDDAVFQELPQEVLQALGLPISALAQQLLENPPRFETLDD